MADLLTMRRRVSRRLDQPLSAVNPDIPTSGVFWTRTEVDEWINEGRRQVYAEIAEIEGPTLAQEAPGTYTANARSVAVAGVGAEPLAAGGIFGLSQDPLKLLGLFDITGDATAVGGAITFIPYNEMQQAQSRKVWGGSRVASWWGSNPMNLSIWPIPSSALSLRLRYIPNQPADLVDGALGVDIPFEIPVVHHDLLVLYAVVQAKKKEEDPSWQDDWTTYRELLDRMKNTMEERQSANSRHVVVTDSADYGPGRVDYY
jgi:hypothetical protein